MIDPLEYTITVKKVFEEGVLFFRGSVKELPDVGYFGQSPGEAYEMTVDAIETLYEMAQEEGRTFPGPAKEQTDFSGRVTLRLTKTLHREAAAQAEIEGVSLNHFLSLAIAQQVANGQMISAMTGGGMPRAASTESNILKFPGMAGSQQTAATEAIDG